MTGAARYRPLGAFRFALALMVVLQHFQHLLPVWQRDFFRHAGLGAIAVAVFFAVSGYVVAEALSTFYAGRPVAFLVNRALRLGPPYAAALALSVAVHAALFATGMLVLWDFDSHVPPWTAARLLTGVLGLVPGVSPTLFGADLEFIPFVWSLRLEVSFYLAAAGTMAIAARAGERVIGWGIAVGLAAAAGFLATGRTGALATAPMFLVGVLLFAVQRRSAVADWAGLVLSMACAAWGFVSWRQHGAPVLAWQLPGLVCLLGLFAALSVLPCPNRWRGLDRRAGDLSYALYLNHYVVGIAAASLADFQHRLLYLLAVLMSVRLAMGMSALAEAPLRAVRDRVRARTL